MSGIKKKQLSEVRSMANPPAIVKLALESICLLLDTSEYPEVSDWKTIRSILNKDSFIPSIVNFDTASITYENYLFLLFSFSEIMIFRFFFLLC